MHCNPKGLLIRKIGIENIPPYSFFWWVLVRFKPELIRNLLLGWVDALPEGLKDQILAIFRPMALNILVSGKGLLERRRNAAWNEDYLTELASNFFVEYF